MADLPSREELIEEIRAAFADVTLGNGVGLSEADAIDDYADEATRRKCRAADEQDDWSRIPYPDLERYRVSPSFFDSEGMRFHLPAYLVGFLSGRFSDDLIFHLTHYDHSRFTRLNSAQRRVVRRYLQFIGQECETWGEEVKRPLIQIALDTLWCD